MKYIPMISAVGFIGYLFGVAFYNIWHTDKGETRDIYHCICQSVPFVMEIAWFVVITLKVIGVIP